MPGTPARAAESSSVQRIIQPAVLPVGLAEKLEVDSFIHMVDPEEQVTSFTVTLERDHEDLEMEPGIQSQQSICLDVCSDHNGWQWRTRAQEHC